MEGERHSLGFETLASTSAIRPIEPLKGESMNTCEHGINISVSRFMCEACSPDPGYGSDPSGDCQHGVYVGGCGIDWMCGWCESDTSWDDYKAIHLRSLRDRAQYSMSLVYPVEMLERYMPTHMKPHCIAVFVARALEHPDFDAVFKRANALGLLA